MRKLLTLGALVTIFAAPQFAQTHTTAAAEHAQTISGSKTLTVSLTASGNGAAANVSIKNATQDGIIYVSSQGNDSNDGLSWGSAKATLSGAYAALPKCTHYSPFAGGLGDTAEKCGLIQLAAGNFTVSSTVTIQSLSVRVVGAYAGSTQLNCTAYPCVVLDPFNNGASFDSHWYLNSYGIQHIQINDGNPGSGHTGLKLIDATGVAIDHVVFSNFSGPNSNCVDDEIENTSGHFAEAQYWTDDMYSNCTNGILINGVTTTSGDFDYSNFLNQHWMMQSGQTAITMTNAAHCNRCAFAGALHQQGAVSNEYGLNMSGTTSIYALWQMKYDNNLPDSITGSASFEPSSVIDTNATKTSVSSVFSPIAYESSAFPVTSNPPQLAGGVWASGWKMTLREGSAAVGNDTYSVFLKTPNWVSVSSSNAAGNGSASAPDTNNGVSMGANGTVTWYEESAPSTPTAGFDSCYADSTEHALKCSYNNGTFNAQTQTIASGTATLASGSVSTNTCQAPVTATATGAATTDSIEWAYTTAPGSADGLMHVSAYVASGSVGFTRCNASSGSQNGTAMVINWRVLR